MIGFLTILGYSLYDTVVVFDKVRENTADAFGSRRMSYAAAANLAVNQTLVRSINTTVVALLPIFAILVVGISKIGPGTLVDLSLALSSVSPSAPTPRSSSRRRCWSGCAATNPPSSTSPSTPVGSRPAPRRPRLPPPRTPRSRSCCRASSPRRSRGSGRLDGRCTSTRAPVRATSRNARHARGADRHTRGPPAGHPADGRRPGDPTVEDCHRGQLHFRHGGGSARRAVAHIGHPGAHAPPLGPLRRTEVAQPSAARAAAPYGPQHPPQSRHRGDRTGLRSRGAGP